MGFLQSLPRLQVRLARDKVTPLANRKKGFCFIGEIFNFSGKFFLKNFNFSKFFKILSDSKTRLEINCINDTIDNFNGATICGRIGPLNKISVDHVKDFKIPKNFFCWNYSDVDGEIY